MRGAVIPLVVPLKAVTESLQTRLGQSPQLNWRLPTQPRSFTTMECGSEVTSTVYGAQTPKSNKIHKGLVGGIKMSLGGSVDLGLLLQTLANHQGLLAREGDRALLSLWSNNGAREKRGSSNGEEDPLFIWGANPTVIPPQPALKRYYRS